MKTPARHFLMALAPAFALAAGGCATIFHGKNQEIEVISEPPGATASALDQKVLTPGVLTLPRKSTTLEIRVEKEGYQTRTIPIRRVKSGLVNLNFIAIPVGFAGGAAAGASSSGDSFLSGDDSAMTGGAIAGAVVLPSAGFAIDYATGAAYRLEPSPIIVRLEPVAALAAGTDSR